MRISVSYHVSVQLNPHPSLRGGLNAGAIPQGIKYWFWGIFGHNAFVRRQANDGTIREVQDSGPVGNVIQNLLQTIPKSQLFDFPCVPIKMPQAATFQD